MGELNQKEQSLESNKIHVELDKLDQPSVADSSSMISVPELVAFFQGIKAKKQELNQQKRDLQATERDLRHTVMQEIDKRWKAIELLKSEIFALQNKCNELTPSMISDQVPKKTASTQTPIGKYMHERRTLLVPLIVAAGLFFYALGIATNLFALPVFSSFFILSYSTAHELAYGVAAAGVALSIAALTLHLTSLGYHEIYNRIR